MTGAGWGGCAVSLVKSSDVLSLLTTVRDRYYLPDPKKALLIKEALFGTEPGGGAAVYIS